MRCAVSVTVGEGACGNDAICLRHCQRAAPTITGAFLRRVKWSMCHSTTNSRSAPANTPPSEKTSPGARISPKRARPGEEAAGWPGTLSVRRRSPACMRRAPGSRDRSRGERNAPKRQPSLRPRSSRTPGYDHSDISPAGTYDRTPYVLMLFIVPPKPDPPLRTRAGVV